MGVSESRLGSGVPLGTGRVSLALIPALFPLFLGPAGLAGWWEDVVGSDPLKGCGATKNKNVAKFEGAAGHHICLCCHYHGNLIDDS